MENIQIRHIGDSVAENEANNLQYYYLNNIFYEKASVISSENKELFFIGRTGSGKSAILEMLRRKQMDAKRVLSITGEDLSTQMLLYHPDITSIPLHLKPLVFKSLWKYIIITNILKTIYVDDEVGKDVKWLNYLAEGDKKSRALLEQFDELSTTKKTITEQVISFLKTIHDFVLNNADKADATLYEVFKYVLSFEKHELIKHIKHKYLYILVDDLDKNWSGKEENIILIRMLFESIIEFSRNFSESIKFVVALRTDIFEQIDFHQIEKVRPYVLEIEWNYGELLKLVQMRMELYWNLTWGKNAWKKFPETIRDGGQEISIYKFLVRRTMQRPRDIISFINLCITETQNRGATYISVKDIRKAESIYSRQRLAALIDEWKFVYPDLQNWIDLFAGKGYKKHYYLELQGLFKQCSFRPKEIVDVLYKVGFLGFKIPEKKYILYSYSSRYTTVPSHAIEKGFVVVQKGFSLYLRQRAEELGEYSDEKHDDVIQFDDVVNEEVNESPNKKQKIRILAIFASSPKGDIPLDLSKEDRSLRECITLGHLRDAVDLDVKHAAKISDLRRSFLDNE